MLSLLLVCWNMFTLFGVPTFSGGSSVGPLRPKSHLQAFRDWADLPEPCVLWMNCITLKGLCAKITLLQRVIQMLSSIWLKREKILDLIFIHVPIWYFIPGFVSKLNSILLLEMSSSVSPLLTVWTSILVSLQVTSSNLVAFQSIIHTTDKFILLKDMTCKTVCNLPWTNISSCDENYT